MTSRLHPDFKDFLIALNKNEVRYIVVGGYAVIYYGYNRTTGDLDIWVEQSKENFKLLMNAFADFGLPLNAISEENFLTNKLDVFTFGLPPVCIEIITAVKGIEFNDSYAHASKVNFDSVPVNMIDLFDLTRNKKAVGRNKDLDDLEHLLRS